MLTKSKILIIWSRREGEREREKRVEIYARWANTFLVGWVNFESKVDFVVESGVHVLTSRTNAPESKATQLCISQI